MARPIVTNRAAWSVCRSVGLSVDLSVTACLSVCHTSEPCKTANLIEMPFGLRILVGSRNYMYVLDGVQIHPFEGSNFQGGEEASRCKVQGHTAIICT